MTDTSKLLSIELYNKFVKDIYKIILQKNFEIIKDFKQIENKEIMRISDIVSLPLIMISGGEAINLYSDPRLINPTKDADLKLIVPGKYSLPLGFKDFIYTDSVKGELFKITNFLNNSFNIASRKTWESYKDNHMKYVEKTYEQIYENLDKFDEEYKLQTNLHKFVYSITLRTRMYIFQDCLKIFKNICKQYNNNFIFTKNFSPIPIDILLSLSSFQKDSSNISDIITKIKNIDTDAVISVTDATNYTITIPLYIMIPRVSVAYKNIKVNNFPFYIDFGKDATDKALSSKIFNSIDDFNLSLQDIKSQIMDYLDLSDEEENEYIRHYFSFTSLIRKRSLTTLSFIKIMITYDSTSDKIIYKFDDEGFIDLWTEFSSQYTETKAKKRYDARIETGDIPSILESVSLSLPNGEVFTSYIKFPVINWLIRDQVRMLIHGLRKETPYSDDWNEDTTVFTPQDIDPLKYCDKILSMIEAYDDVMFFIEDQVNKGAADDLSKLFDNCRINFDYVACSPDSFVSYIIRDIINKDYWVNRLTF